MALLIQGLLEEHEDSVSLVFSELPKRRSHLCLLPGTRREQLGFTQPDTEISLNQKGR